MDLGEILSRGLCPNPFCIDVLGGRIFHIKKKASNSFSICA